ncbi:winged helix-turn-helix DNA-binding family protein [Burkholderia cenocepacia]|uniref:Winged helix-turn-helix DNA-binding family protein n=1 Tax=Burkholderia cenocepacia TaxID=95486 RepID=A0AAN0RR01_9BURK|nr:winged helix-turn-helix DNA-binding family protein [Burkholderia cenocepacia]
MSDEKMSFTQRCICERLAENPGVTLRDLSSLLRSTPDSMKRTINRLASTGYIRLGRRSKKGYALHLTGKPFPASSDVMPADRRRHIAFEVGIAVLMPAMRAMVDVGRAVA